MKYVEIINETLLSGEFKFGFELEAVDTREDRYYIEKNIQKYFKDDDIVIKEDGSIEPDEDIGGAGFEFASPVMSFSPLNINNVIKFLSDLPDYSIYTNESCGFHTYISFPNMTSDDTIWILSNLALDDEMRIEIEYFHNIEFFHKHYAKNEFLDNIYNDLNGKSINWSSLRTDFSNEKKRSIRIHPQGTLEWRGPRNFLNSEHIEDIKEFFSKLYKFIKFIIRTMDKTDILGISKKEFFNKLDLSNKGYDIEFGEKSYKKVYFRAVDNPSLLNKLPYKIKIRVLSKDNEHNYLLRTSIAEKHFIFDDTENMSILYYIYSHASNSVNNIFFREKYPFTLKQLKLILKAAPDILPSFTRYAQYLFHYIPDLTNELASIIEDMPSHIKYLYDTGYPVDDNLLIIAIKRDAAILRNMDIPYTKEIIMKIINHSPALIHYLRDKFEFTKEMKKEIIKKYINYEAKVQYNTLVSGHMSNGVKNSLYSDVVWYIDRNELSYPNYKTDVKNFLYLPANY